MHPKRKQRRPGAGLRCRADRGRRTLRYARAALAALGLTLALLCGLAGVANAVPASMPPAPVDLSAQAAGDFAIHLTWDAPTAPAGLTLSGYDVYQGTSPGGESGTPVNSADLVTATSYTATDLNNETTYYFDVIAIYQQSEGGGIPSAASNEASATTTPGGSTPAPGDAPAPGGLTAAAASSSEVDLTWDAPVAPFALPVVGYDVYQGASSGGESATPVNSVPVTATSYPVTGLESGTTYYFEVTAVYRDGQSPPSSEASAITASISGTATPTVTATGAPTSDATPTAAAAGRVTPGATPTAAGVLNPSPTPTATAGSPTPGRTPTASSTAGPGRLIAILLVVAIVLLAGILALLAVRLRVTRIRPPSQPSTSTPQAARIQAKPRPGPPTVARIRVTGTDATHAVRIEPRPGARSVAIEEVRT